VALNRVAGGRDIASDCGLWDVLKEALPQPWGVLKHPGYAVGEFNDHPTTTHADIMALFDRAIAAQPVQP
jgi:hypothetical protein